MANTNIAFGSERSAAETLDPIAAQNYRDMARQWLERARRADEWAALKPLR
jgi:hypothetical protein